MIGDVSLADEVLSVCSHLHPFLYSSFDPTGIPKSIRTALPLLLPLVCLVSAHHAQAGTGGPRKGEWGGVPWPLFIQSATISVPWSKIVLAGGPIRVRELWACRWIRPPLSHASLTIPYSPEPIMWTLSV